MRRDMSKVICHCMNVTVGDIKNALDDGAKTFEEVQEITQASTGCGCCADDVKAVIKELSATLDK